MSRVAYGLDLIISLGDDVCGFRFFPGLDSSFDWDFESLTTADFTRDT